LFSWLQSARAPASALPTSDPWDARAQAFCDPSSPCFVVLVERHPVLERATPSPRTDVVATHITQRDVRERRRARQLMLPSPSSCTHVLGYAPGLTTS